MELELEDEFELDLEEKIDDIEGLKWLEVSSVEVLEGVNPRKSLNEKNISELQEVDAEDLLPLIVAYYEGRYINIDGHHRLESRVRNNETKVKAFVEKIDSMEEIIKKAFTTNVNHGIRLTTEEVRAFTKKVIENKESTTEGFRKLIIDQINKEYQIPKGMVQAVINQLIIAKAIEEKNPKMVEAINKMPIKILNKLRNIAKESDEKIVEFVTGFGSFLEIATWADQKECYQMSEMFLEGKIKTLADFNKNKSLENFKNENSVNLIQEDPEGIFSDDEDDEDNENKEARETLKEMNNKSNKINFELKLMAKNISEEAASRKKSFEKILTTTNIATEDIEATIEGVQKTIEYYQEIKKIFENAKGKK